MSRNHRNATKTAGKRLADRLSDNQQAALYGLDYVRSMINIEDCDPQQVPDDVTAKSAVFKSPFVFNLPSSGVWNPDASPCAATEPFGDDLNGESVVAVFPGTDASIVSTLGVRGVYFDETTSDLMTGIHPFMLSKELGDVTNASSTLSGFIAHPISAESLATIPRLDSSGVPWYEITIADLADPTVGVPFAVDVVNATSMTVANGAEVMVEVCQAISGLTVHSEFFVGATDCFVVPVVPAGGPVVGFNVRIDDQAADDGWQFSLGQAAPTTPTASFIMEEGSAQAYAVRNTPDLFDLQSTQAERTTALTMLCSYMGSDLQNGGQAALARLPQGFTPILEPGGDYYTALARYPTYASDFALKCGGFVWWCPDHIQEWFFAAHPARRSTNIQQVSSLWYAAKRDNRNQTIRVDVIQAIETLTRSRQYRISLGPVNSSFDSVIHVAKTLPAVTMNDNHKSLLNKALAYAGNWLKSPANWIKLLTTGAKGLTSLLAL